LLSFCHGLIDHHKVTLEKLRPFLLRAKEPFGREQMGCGTGYVPVDAGQSNVAIGMRVAY